MKDRAFDLIGLGECMVELWSDAPLGTSATLNRSFGGDVLNSLVTAARLGTRTAFISRVGNDPFGRALLEAWQSEGIDTQHAPLVDGENGVYFISLLEHFEREFTYRRASSAASKITPEHLEPEFITSSHAILLSGITQAISESAQATTLEAARIAKNAGTLVAFDPNYRPKLWAARGGLQAARAAWQELLPFVDALLISHPADSILITDNNLEPQELARKLNNQIKIVAIKLGENGLLLAHSGILENIPVVPPRFLKDTTGAGDAWNGAFLHGLTRGLTPQESAKLGNRVASAKLEFRGAIPPHSLP